MNIHHKLVFKKSDFQHQENWMKKGSEERSYTFS